MKKIKITVKTALFFLVLTAMTLTAKALSDGDAVKVSLPLFDISLNGEKLSAADAEYPVVVYNDIVYIPVSGRNTTEYNYLQYLGVDCGEIKSYSTYKKLFVRSLWFDGSIPNRLEISSGTDGSFTEIATVSENDSIIVNRFGNVSEVRCTDYPMLTYKGREYIPMTYEIITRLGLGYEFSTEKGLVLSKAQIPPRIVSVPEFPVILNGVVYKNSISEYPFLQYNSIVFMPLTKEICDFMGIQLTHKAAKDTEHESIDVSNVPYASENPDFDYIKEGEVYSSEIREPTDGELYINGKGTRWHIYGMEYSPMKTGEVYYLPLTWQIAHDYLGWEYDFDIQSGLRIGNGIGKQA